MLKTTIKKEDKPRAHAWLDSACDSLSDNKQYTIEIKEKKKKRSLNANAYAWALIDGIAERNGLPPEYVYWKSVREIAGNSFVTEVNAEAADLLVKTWSSKGLGWQAVKLDERGDKLTYRLIYGSSVYDTKQMSQLIDNLQQEAQEAGVETLAEREIQELIKAWGS